MKPDSDRHKILQASFISAIVMFLWGWVFWGIIVMQSDIYRLIPREDRGGLVSDLLDVLKNDGVYYYPLPDEAEREYALQDWNERHESGPLLEIHFRRDGIRTMEPRVLVFGFTHMWLTAALLAWLLNCHKNQLASFRSRFGFLFVIGFIGATWIDLSRIIWFYHAPGHELYHWTYHVTGVMAGSIVLAALIRPRQKTESVHLSSDVDDDPGTTGNGDRKEN